MKGTEEVKFFQYYPLFSASFQSLSVTPSDRQRLIPGSPAPQTMIEQNIPSSTHLSAFRRRDVNSPKISISPVEDEENEYEFDKVVEVRGVGVAVSHPVHELGRRSRKLTGPPMMMPQKQKSARSTSLLWLLSLFSLFLGLGRFWWSSSLLIRRTFICFERTLSKEPFRCRRRNSISNSIFFMDEKIASDF